IQSEEGTQRLGSSRPDQTRNPEDLTLAQRETGRHRLASPRELLHLENRRADAVRDAWIALLDVTPDHQPDDLRKVHPPHLAGAHTLPVAQDGEAVTDRLAFLEEVTDVDHANTAIAKAAHDGKEVLGVALGEAA